jgi:hypothetical protein
VPLGQRGTGALARQPLGLRLLDTAHSTTLLFSCQTAVCAVQTSATGFWACAFTWAALCRLLCRSIDHAGGLDAYLLKTPDRWLFSDVGSDLKYRIGLIYKQRWYDAAQARRLEQQQQQRQRQQQGTVAAEAPASTSSSPPAARPAAVTGPRGFSSGAGGAGSRGGAAELDALRRQEADKMLGWAGPRSSSSMGPGPPQQPSCQQHPGGG